MNIPIYQVDAFASAVFAGNPAAVCVLERWLDDPVLQAIAAENNLSETAFLVREGDGFALRWFTPAVEVALCGHATLASAWVVFHELGWPGDTVRFHTRWSGVLPVTRVGEVLTLDFPARPAEECATPVGLEHALGARIEQCYTSFEDLLVLTSDEAAVRAARPDFRLLGKFAPRGVILTARGEEVDFVSRFFAPAAGIDEDPVTGSAHCVLAPYWGGVLGKTTLHARQVSRRGGELTCTCHADRVLISGRAVPYLRGTITLPAPA